MQNEVASQFFTFQMGIIDEKHITLFSYYQQVMKSITYGKNRKLVNY
jgi:hypothetical protein